MSLQVAPSILSADFLHLGDDIRMLNRHADIIHLDVMDGTFVPNISFGFSVIEPVLRIAEIPTDAHLMIIHPEKYIERFCRLGVTMLSFHLEAALEEGSDPAGVLRMIRSFGVRAGLAFNPGVPVEDCFPYLADCDYVLAMSVQAGFGGQKIDPNIADRVRRLKAEIRRRGLEVLVEIDGGVTVENAPALAEAGVDIFVAGSTVFKAQDPPAVIRSLRAAAPAAL